MRLVVSFVLYVLGAVAVVVGFWTLAPWLGVVAGGGMALGVGYLLDPTGGD